MRGPDQPGEKKEQVLLEKEGRFRSHDLEIFYRHPARLFDDPRCYPLMWRSRHNHGLPGTISTGYILTH